VLFACGTAAPTGRTGGGQGGGASAGSAGVGGTSPSGGAGFTAGAAGTPASGGASGGSSSGAGGSSAGNSGTAGGGSGGDGNITPGTWHASVSSAVSDETLNQEYGTWKTRHVQDCGNGSSVVKRDAGSVVSESIAYGMLLSAAFGDRPLFDGLWKYYTDHLDTNGLMNWATGVCDAPGNNNANAATDGDLDAVMALVQAHARWSDGGYLSQAQGLAAKILQFEVVTCSGRATLKPGDVWGGCLDPNNETRINPSYFAPGYYRVFAAKFPAQAAQWNALLEGTYELYPILQARMGGLVPDWSDWDGGDWYGSDYYYDACRTPWRVATDYAWSGDARARTFMQNVVAWLDSNGGLPAAAQQQNSAFIGAFALAGAYDQAKLDAYMSAWLGATVDDMPYFQNTLRILYLLVATGKFSQAL
jgi:endo-1,4-beta-D-glucanase Y